MADKMQIAVIGAGTMGHGIAQTYAAHGYPTALVDVNREALDMAARLIGGNLDTMKHYDYISAEGIKNVETLLTYTTDFDAAVAGAGTVVEAVPEDPAIKDDIFQRLGARCAPDTFLLSTTSVLDIYQFLKPVSHPQRMLITHWCNPPHLIPLVEIVCGPHSTDEAVAEVRAQLTGIGKSPIVLKKCIPGFAVNRLNLALVREAGYMVDQGWISPEDADTAFTANMGIKAPFEGPLELMDYIGWDVATAAGMYLFPHICSSTDGSPFATAMMEKGHAGLKSGRGIYDYSGKPREEWNNIRNARIMQIARIAQAIRADKQP